MFRGGIGVGGLELEALLWGDLVMHLFLMEGKMMRLEFTSADVLGGGRFRAWEGRYVLRSP